MIEVADDYTGGPVSLFDAVRSIDERAFVFSRTSDDAWAALEADDRVIARYRMRNPGGGWAVTITHGCPDDLER